MSFHVTILGSGAALPTANRAPSSQYVVCNERHILIDCGEGTQTQLRKYKVHIQRITHILISHLHGDHYFGLVGLLSTLHLLGRDKGLTVYGPEPLEGIIRQQLEIGDTKLGFSLNFVPLNGKEHKLIFEDNKVEIWCFPLRHRIPTNGFVIREKPKERSLDGERFRRDGLSLELIPYFRRGEDVVREDGIRLRADDYSFPAPTPKSYAYCSDTIYDPTLISYIKNVSILYHEATFLHEKLERAKATFHTTASQAAEIAKAAEVEKLLLGHLSARYENGRDHEREARKIFENTQVVEDGDQFKF
jgi:ribonuclease Z